MYLCFMSYQKKYYFSFKQLHTNDVNLVEIWQDTDDVLTAEEVRGSSAPFVTEISELDHKFQPVIGQGCEVSMFSDSDRKFLEGLYHVDAQEFVVKHYINGVINYLGYLNSEMYSEDYSSSANYIISVSGNDGLALGKRYTFIQDDETDYEGIYSEWDLLMICLNKIGLDWDEIRVSLSTTFSDFSGSSDKTILHESYVDSANFYDEDDAAMTLREVMESILQPYGAQLFCESGHVYIVDIHTRTKGFPIFQRFTYSTESYIGEIAIQINKVIQNIGYSKTGQEIELSGGVNKQVVAYSPYPTSTVLEQCLVDEDEFETVPDDWIARQDYFYKVLSGNSYLNIIDDETIANFESSYYDGTVNGTDYEEEYSGYLKYGASYPPQEIVSLITKPIVNISSSQAVIQDDGSSGVAVSINFDFLCTFQDSKVYRGIIKGDSGIWTKYRLYFQIKIGEWYYDSDTSSWVKDSSKYYILEFSSLQREYWTSVEDLINIGNSDDDTIYSGAFDFVIISKLQHYSYWSKEWYDYSVSDNREYMIWLKNLDVSIINQNSSEIPDDDVEYIGTLDDRYEEEGDQITVTTGTDIYASDKAKITWLNGDEYNSIQEWTRNEQTYKLEELLLNSLVSNYRAGFYKLNNMYLKHGFSILNVFTDNNISDKVFMIKSATFDYANNEVDCNLWETSPDDLTIVLE